MDATNFIEIELVPKRGLDGSRITKSSPRDTFKFLSLYDKEYKIKGNKYKELWLLADRDRWREMIENIYQECQKSNYNFALSNPCFELWLLLHRKLVDDFTEEERLLLFSNPTVNEKWEIRVRAKRKYLEKHLIHLCG